MIAILRAYLYSFLPFACMMFMILISVRPLVAQGRMEVPYEKEKYYEFLERSRNEAREAASRFEPNFDYDNKRSLEPVTQQQRECGAVPFVRSYLKPMFEQSIPAKQERKTELFLRVARGEVEPASFGLYALQDLAEVTASPGTWSGPDLSPGKLELHRVESAPVRHGRSSRTTQWQSQPVRLWPIDPGESFSLKANSAFQFWGVLRIDPDATPGRYSLPISITASGKPLYTLQLTVEILPFALPAVKAAYGVYEGQFVSEEEMADMVDHGCNSMSMWGNYPSHDETTDVLDMTALEQYLRRLSAAGLNHSWVWYVGTKAHLRFRMGDALGEKGIIKVLKRLEEGTLSGDFPRNLSLTIDEAICLSPDGSRGDQSKPGTIGNRWKDFVDICNWISDNAPGLKRFGVSLNRHEDAVLHGGLIDILSCNGDFEQNSKWCAENGIKMYTYGSFNKGTYPAQSRYNSGFYPWTAGSDGTYAWAYKWSKGNPFNDLDSGVMDWCLVYPGPEGTLISTPAWEAWREGVDDRRYLEMYESLVAQGKADGALLDRLRDRLKPASFREETVVGDSDFGAVVEGFEKMDDARNEVIDAILAAMK